VAQVNLKQLIAKFNDVCREKLEGAAGLCLSRTNYNVEIEHWIMKLVEHANSDLSIIFRQFDVDVSRLTADLMKSIDKFKTGNSRSPALSPDLVSLAQEAWLIGSIDLAAKTIRSGHVICALLQNDSLSRIAYDASDEFKKITLDSLLNGFYSIVADSSESNDVSSSADTDSAESGRPSGPSSTPALDQYTIDLTKNAKEGKIDPVLGRDSEIRQLIDILARRRQNNPILTGEAGVGKTAVVEGFALRLISDDIPPALQNVSIHTLDLGLLQAGAGVKGEFENRLKSVIAEVKASPHPIIMFIDEAHTLIGAGGGAGQGDAANLLKPALARGELRTIAATTWAEYKKYFEKDAALARRFQVVKVEEPTEKSAIEMMRGLTSVLEKHHGVRILNDAVVDAVKLSSRYISGRQLPDKSVSLLDTTCARIGLSQSAKPPAIEDCQRRIEQINVEKSILEREGQLGLDHSEKISELDLELAKLTEDFEAMNDQWTSELELVSQINVVHEMLQDTDIDPAKKTESVDELVRLEKELKQLQNENPLVHAEVNSQSVAETVAAWTGIPVGRMVADEINTVMNLKPLMEKAIIGQSHALDQIAQSIRTSRANLSDPCTPIGVFLLAGTSGVGKTETAISLAELLYGGEQNMTVINMSEYKEEHKVSLLMGSPPGYVGYGEGGVLTEAVRRKPYSVVLLDEMEKAHPGVQDVFYQVFDKGMMKDGEGRDIDFKNTVIIMTSNAGTDLIKSLCDDPEMMPSPDAFTKAVFPELLKTFKPAFLGRVKVVPYYPLNDEVMKKIVGLKLNKIAKRVKEHYKASFEYGEELVKTITERCSEVDTGARNVDHILTKTLLPELAGEFLAKMAEGLAISKVSVNVDDGGKFIYEIS